MIRGNKMKEFLFGAALGLIFAVMMFLSIRGA
jgi:hypothetical protein